jgi:hypothetical protein
MSTLQLRRQLKKKVDALPTGALRSASDFLDYLEHRGNGRSATNRSRIAAMRRRLGEAERQVAAGRVIRADKLKRKY